MEYGINDFVDDGSGTETDRATGLKWQQADSGAGHDWESALAYAEEATLSGLTDWRLPNAKELHGIVDRSEACPARSWFIFFHILVPPHTILTLAG